MGVSQELIDAARAVEAATSVSASVLIAVAIVETDARAFAPVGDRLEPLIRFEGHYFDRRLDPDARREARLAGLAHPSAGAVKNPAGQAARWAMLERAAGIDRLAAYESTSWGLAQVMGAHWPQLGFDSAEALAEMARGSVAGQLTIAARFLKEGGLAGLLLAGDHAGFARRYNGPAYARNRYDTKIADAHARALRLLGAPAVLRIGARGEAVAELQRALTARKFALVADGFFGPRTERAVKAFQAARDLVVDGLVGPRTLGALAAPG